MPKISTTNATRTLVLPANYTRYYGDFQECLYCTQPLRHEMHAYNHFVLHHYTPESFPGCERSEPLQTKPQSLPVVPIAQNQKFFIWCGAMNSNPPRWIEVSLLCFLQAQSHGIATAHTKR